jgi:hypothetical protein
MFYIIGGLQDAKYMARHKLMGGLQKKNTLLSMGHHIYTQPSRSCCDVCFHITFVFVSQPLTSIKDVEKN